MYPNVNTYSLIDCENIKIVEPKKEGSFISDRMPNLVGDILDKYPPHSTITKLNSTFEIKQHWLYNEWAPECQFSKYIRPNFPSRNDLDPESQSPNVDLIQSTFHDVRGKWALWQNPREKARWKKIEVSNLELDWVIQNVEVLYPSNEQFEVSELKGIVLWKNKESNSGKRYELYEGNHRISAWLAAQTPNRLPAVIFIGKPAKQL